MAKIEPISSATNQNGFTRVWSALTRPHPSIQEIGEQRLAQLAISLTLVMELLIFSGFMAGAQRTGYVEAFGGFGASLIGLLIAYLFAKTKNFRLGIFLLTIILGSSAYIDIIRQPGQADIAADVFVFVPLSLIIASAFLSGWAVFLLVGLNIGAFLSIQWFGIPLPDNAGGLAGVITVIGVVLILLGNFRNRTESLRFVEIRTINRDLEVLSNELERRVQERTTALEQVNQRTSNRLAQLQAITQISEAIAILQDLGELFPTITQLISERFNFYHVGIFLVDTDREFAILQAANSEGGQEMLKRGHRLKLGTGVVGYTAQTSLPRIALDVGADAVFFDNPNLPNTRSEAALPLKIRNETIGVLDVQSLEAGAFNAEDLQLLSTLANQVSIAIENTRLLTETRAALRQVEEVYNEFTRAEWSRTVARADQTGFRYQSGRIEMLPDSASTPELASAARTGEIVAKQGNGSTEKRATVAVPVKLRGEVIGVIQIEAGEAEKNWQKEEVSLVQAIAERAALALENARLFQDARRRAAKERLISDATAKISRATSIENILQVTAQELEQVLGGSEVLIQFKSEKE